MAYATSEDLLTHFGATELAQVATPKRFDIVTASKLETAIGGGDYSGDPEEEALDACLAAIDQALEIADSVIDSYLAVRYTLPLVTTPNSLQKRALDLARFELHDEQATEEVRNRRNDAIAWLKDLAAGKAKLGDSSIDSGAGSNSGFGISDPGGKTFSHDSLSGYGI